MAKILARIDDELHARLKRCAAEQGRSLNDLVTRARDARQAVRVGPARADPDA